MPKAEKDTMSYIHGSDQIEDQHSDLLFSLEYNLSYQRTVGVHLSVLRRSIADNRLRAARLSHAFGRDLDDRELLGSFIMTERINGDRKENCGVNDGARINSGSKKRQSWFVNRLGVVDVQLAMEYLRSRRPHGNCLRQRKNEETNSVAEAVAMAYFPEMTGRITDREVRAKYRYHPLLCDSDPGALYPSLSRTNGRIWKRRFFVDGWDETDHPFLSEFYKDVPPPDAGTKWTASEVERLIDTIGGKGNSDGNSGSDGNDNIYENNLFDSNRKRNDSLNDNRCGTSSTGISDLGNIDFDEVAKSLYQNLNERKYGTNMRKFPISFQRSAAACSAKYASSAARHCVARGEMKAAMKRRRTRALLPLTSITKEESLRILSAVSCDPHRRPRWIDVARATKSRLTPWQCFVHYRTHFSGAPTGSSGAAPSSSSSSISSSAWTPSEDELLLKYVAYFGGPRMAINRATGQVLARRAFPHRSGQGIFKRAQIGGINPNYDGPAGVDVVGKGRAWTEEEERRLVLCMKVYKDHKPSAIAGASAHFPSRHPTQLWEKWHRNLNPSFSRDPWTAKEDCRLVDAVRAASVRHRHGPWGEIAILFPNRTKAQLCNRWNEVVTEGDLLEDLKNRMKMQEAMGGRRMCYRRNGKIAGEIGKFDPDDFVMRAKRPHLESEEE
uniref:Myb-like domain-containing protein n=1 Tax=Corethron hystrix TaxID=216773 RepID=A0A7S1BFD0_9STRA|mmetsp:Transcript_23035/g.52726  ORF Transcript_23035/g.52726 Transcript_23035/m.52726 type:complete len:669 (+) Transcript_23035:129-2135(+)